MQTAWVIFICGQLFFELYNANTFKRDLSITNRTPLTRLRRVKWNQPVNQEIQIKRHSAFHRAGHGHVEWQRVRKNPYKCRHRSCCIYNFCRIKSIYICLKVYDSEVLPLFQLKLVRAPCYFGILCDSCVLHTNQSQHFVLMGNAAKKQSKFSQRTHAGYSWILHFKIMDVSI